MFEVLFPPAGAWLREQGPVGRAWVLRAFRQVDTWRQAGLTPSEPLLWALVFGEYHEALAALHLLEGRREPAALAAVVGEHLSGMTNRVNIPRQVAQAIAHIMAAQPQFRLIRGRRPFRFARRPSFVDAFVYFKFAAARRGRHQEELAWWNAMFSKPGSGEEGSEQQEQYE